MHSDIYSLIKSRRSIRAYEEGRAIAPEILNKLIEAGTWAASGKNLQNWHFYVLQQKKRDDYLALSQKSWLHIKDNLQQRLKPSLYQFTERFFYTLGGAPVVILATADLSGQDHPQTQLGNVYLAVQNIVLAAQAEGLGTCILGSPLEIENDVRTFLGLESLQEAPNIKLVCGITLGYPAHSPPTPARAPNRVTFLR
jgi:nitroreductase